MSEQMLVALLDTETTGLTDADRAIEVAVTVYSLTHASAVGSFAWLIACDVPNGAASINGIKQELLSEHASPAEEVWARALRITRDVVCFAAHRAEFDRRFVAKEMLEKPWVCTKTDLRWPGGRQGDSLVQLALSMGLGVASAHRASSDVDTMARILTRAAEMGADLPEMFKRGMRPKKRYVARVPFDMNPVLKANGFMWDDARKQWYRALPPEDVEALPFRVVQVD